jgi:hypothetical protein
MAIINFNSISGVSTISVASSITVGNNVHISGDRVTATGFVGNLTGTVNSSGIATFSSGIVVSAGTTAAPSISPSGDSNTGIFFPSADTIAFGEGGVESARFDSSGKLGISTTSPGTLLDVRGGNDAIIRAKVASGQYGGIILLSEEGNDLTLGYARNSSNYGSDTSAGDLSVKATSSSAVNLHFVVGPGNATTKMKIDSNGRVTMPFQPFAFVARSGNISMTSGSKIPFDSVVDSRGLTWNTSNNNFVVPATGVYTFSIYIRLATTGVNYIFAQIRSNGTALYGSQYLYLQKPNTLDSFQTAGVTISVKLTQNDTVDVTGSWNVGTHTLEGSQSLMSIVFNG